MYNAIISFGEKGAAFLYLLFYCYIILLKNRIDYIRAIATCGAVRFAGIIIICNRCMCSIYVFLIQYIPAYVIINF